jgi:hypothetical protein
MSPIDPLLPLGSAGRKVADLRGLSCIFTELFD